jgi:hypothetical protein
MNVAYAKSSSRLLGNLRRSSSPLYFITIISAHANYDDASLITHHSLAVGELGEGTLEKSLLKQSGTLKQHILNETATDAINSTPTQRAREREKGKITRKRKEGHLLNKYCFSCSLFGWAMPLAVPLMLPFQFFYSAGYKRFMCVFLFQQSVM